MTAPADIDCGPCDETDRKIGDPRLSRRQALFIRELARCDGWLGVRDLALALGIRARGNTMRVLVWQIAAAVRRKFGDVIEARAGRNGGYRLTEYGRGLL